MFVGITIGLLTVVDWSLSEKQKEQLRDYGERLWIWLDDQRYGRFTRALRSRRVQKLLTVTIYAILLIFQILIVTLDPEYANGSLFSITVLIASLLGLPLAFFILRNVHSTVIDWAVGRRGVFGFFVRSAAAYAVGSIALVLSFILMLFASKLSGFGDPTVHLSIRVVGLVVQLIIACVAYPLAAETTMIGAMLGWSLLWFLVVLLLLVSLRTIQFVVLRVVEYPKGPILGLSGLLIGIAAILKSLL
jgi:hypothetical protein